MQVQAAAVAEDDHGGEQNVCPKEAADSGRYLGQDDGDLAGGKRWQRAMIDDGLNSSNTISLPGHTSSFSLSDLLW